MRKPSVFLLVLLAAAASLGAQSLDEARKRLVAVAEGYRGAPYVYGADEPPSFDCSGFVQYVYRTAISLDIPRNSKSQYAAGAAIAKEALKPGDILVFDTVGGSPSHVALYLGSGSMIHAASAGPRTGVIVSALDDSYFGPRFIGARTFLGGFPGAQDAAPMAAGPQAALPQAAAPQAAAAPVAAAPTAAAPKSSPQAAPAPAAPPPQAAAPAAAKPLQARPSAAEPAVAQIGFVIPAERASYTDKIPTAKGTRLAFTLTNGTGADGGFTVIFYKTAVDFSKSTEIHREFAKIRSGGSVELPPYLFSEPGIYKLIVKDSWNGQLMERIFKVIEPRG